MSSSKFVKVCEESRRSAGKVSLKAERFIGKLAVNFDMGLPVNYSELKIRVTYYTVRP